MRIRAAMSRLLGVVLAALFVSPAGAQDIQNFKPAVGTWNYITVEGAAVAEHGEIVPSLMVNYANSPLVLRDADDEVTRTIVGDLTSLDFMAVVGILDRAELGVVLPIHFVDGDVLQDAGQDGVGLGDLRLIPKFRLYGKARDEGFGVAIAVPVSVPTGDPDKVVSEDQVTVSPKLLLEGRTVVRFAANLGARFRPEKRTLEDLEIQNEVIYGAGLGVPLGTDEVEGLLEGYGAVPISDLSDAANNAPVEANIGIRWFTPVNLVATGGVGTGLRPDYGSPALRVFAGLAYHDQERDRDQDGILDQDDACPDDPEDKDQFEDLDGCPDPDNDQDGIPDLRDQCPNKAEDKDGFEDSDGCPDPDNDNDRVLDTDDQCPNDAENYNSWEDADGCPDDVPDTDGDGLKDPDDQCPNDPEDKDGFEDTDGCPDPDNDRDGILDVDDKCPNEPETINGNEDEDGCPDEGLTKIRITAERIEILEKIYFEVNKDVIKPVSYGILDQVAAALRAHKNIKRVEVQGHTDSDGSERYNLDLSQRRAAAVRRHLVGLGTAPERLTARGYGESMPIDTNKTRDGKANNRRVEFVILESE